VTPTTTRPLPARAFTAGAVWAAFTSEEPVGKNRAEAVRTHAAACCELYVWQPHGKMGACWDRIVEGSSLLSGHAEAKPGRDQRSLPS